MGLKEWTKLSQDERAKGVLGRWDTGAKGMETVVKHCVVGTTGRGNRIGYHLEGLKRIRWRPKGTSVPEFDLLLCFLLSLFSKKETRILVFQECFRSYAPHPHAHPSPNPQPLSSQPPLFNAHPLSTSLCDHRQVRKEKCKLTALLIGANTTGEEISLLCCK